MKLMIILLLALSPFSRARAQNKPTILRRLEFPAPVREKLRGHMATFQTSMQGIVEMLSKGKWDVLKKEGEMLAKIELTAGEPTVKFPPKFEAYAQELRSGAKEMAAAAWLAKGGGVLINYHRMLATCMKCHADYAPNYFDRHKDYVPPQELPPKYYKSPYDWR